MKKVRFEYKIGIFLINLIARTWRIKLIGNYPDNPAVIAFWHGKMLPGWYLFRNRKSSAIVSSSKDGEILTQILSKWGFNVVRGSSDKGGKEALRQMINQLMDGYYLLITPDGPKGPPERMKAGAVISAQRANVPLFLCGIRIKRKYIFKKSWDKFEFPLPFSRIDIVMYENIYINNSLNREEIDKIISELEIKLLYLNT